MKDVGDGEVVAEGGDDEGDGGEQNRSENCDAGAAGGFAEALPARIILERRARAGRRQSNRCSAPSASSKAKLPICAMWENPNVFFQKAEDKATRNGTKTGCIGRTCKFLTRVEL